MRGSEGRTELLRGSRPTFPDVRGQVEDIILGNRDAKLASDPHTQPETGAVTFNIRHLSRKLGGPMRGSEDPNCCAEARPTFPDVRGPG
ncbi:hypothetical protein TNIN_317421 [Trichonephila inaurata madagascariensis]|uniref:Uncharacterized protein n=1 Tax=Trichonephila inaurata madagascariensis TaxID=2747483 RepID=A0A8X7CH73_9ARAC|nr:hypothetical protein TNIN_317421 [Trichonephila inaurata madagascariensis]